jgi:hypothetical protein
MTSFRHRMLAPLAAGLLLLGACSSGGDASESPADDTVAQEPVKDDPAADTSGKDRDGAAAPGSSTGADCLVGTWLTDRESIAAVAIASLGAGAGADAYSPEVTVTGDSLITFADGVVRTEYLDQAAVMTLVVDGMEIRSVSRGSGVVVGTYTATDTEIVQSNLDTSGMTMVIESYLDGALQPMAPSMVEDYLAATEAGGTSTYTCTPTELITTPVVAGVDTTGFTTRLVRQ